MPIDASIYGQFAPKVQSPLDVQNALAQSAQSQLAMQHTRMQLQQMQADQADQNALRAAYRGGADPSTPEGRQALIQAAPLQAPAIFKSQADLAHVNAQTAQAQSTADKNTAEIPGITLKQATDRTAALAARWGSVKTPQDVVPLYQQAVKDGLMKPEDAIAEIQKVPTDATFGDYAKAQFVKGQSLAQQMDAQQKQQEEQGRNQRNAANIKKDYGVAQIHESGQNARSAASLKKDYLVAGVDPQTGQYVGASGGDDTEKQLNYWAEVVRKGGVLPPGLARGQNGSAFVREVTKRAAMGSTTPEDLMANQAEFAGAKSGQRTLGTRQANVEMAATEAYNMIPIALSASNKVDRTRFPNLNSLLMAAEKGTGDENVVQLATATNSLINSYARAISPSGTPTVSDKEHAREILDKAYSKGQYKAATDIMAQEIEAARKSPVQVKAHMRPGASDSAPAPAPSGFKYIGPAPAGK